MDMQPEITGLLSPEEKAMNDVVPFFFEGARVRTVNIDGEPHFVGIDVCERLGYVNSSDAMKQHCRGVVKRYPIVDALGRIQKTRVLSEPDVLRLIVGSQLPTAERFERWLFEELLPTIRKTGSYSLPSAQQYPPLTPEYRSAIGGIVKSVSASQNRPVFQMLEMLKREIAEIKAASVAAPTRHSADRDYWPMLEIVKAAGVGPAGRRPLIIRCIASMRKYCIQTGRSEAVKVTTSDEGKDRFVFDMAAVDAWLAESGAAIIAAHKAKREEP